MHSALSAPYFPWADAFWPIKAAMTARRMKVNLFISR